ncbi:MAG TPA: methyltransferase domain-containing protein [Rhizomicrobium sp.]|nr:methyltransferase domain-containing protein [Rhizomicrobium sp.]
MMNQKRREDMARRIATLGGYRALSGATVLEVGADLDGVSAQMLVDAGAARVISTNLNEEWRGQVSNTVERRPLDARKIADAFEPGSIDIIFGVSLLEHIDGLDVFFDGARRVLSNDGLFYAHGGPIWSSAKGHHIIAKTESAEYRFGVSEKNPIPDWAQLIHSEESLADTLLARGVPESDAGIISAFVFRSPEQNRLGYRSICDLFAASGFTLIEQRDNAFKPPPPDILDAIERGPYGGEERYDVSGITFIARQ